MTQPPPLAEAVVRWQKSHGRHDLPWQNTCDPYRVWLSEIMLQQTQVTTVLAYYERFLARFPDVFALALASEDDVLGLWSGLGYYSRARNLHQTARLVVERYGGAFPPSAEQLLQLPGVGRSTASAIAAFCFNERVPILDANVRRVLTRYLAFSGDLARKANEKDLWNLAAELVPAREVDMPAYTQGLMDLGASVCSPVRPSCMVCPLEPRCGARALGDPSRFPVRTRRLQRRTESWWLLFLWDDLQRVWLEKRPAPGIWAGLQCPPVFDDEATLLRKATQLQVSELVFASAVRHTLTHRDLVLTPTIARFNGPQNQALQGGQWVAKDRLPSMGLPAPVRSLLSAS